MIRWRRSTTLLCCPKLEGAFSAGTKGVTIAAGIRTISLRGKTQEKTMPRKLIIKWRRSATLLCHPELEGAFSAGTKGVPITAGIPTTSLCLFAGSCERSTPFPLRPYEFAIFCTTEIPFAHCSHEYFSLELLLSENLLHILCHPKSIHRVWWVSLTSQIPAS